MAHQIRQEDCSCCHQCKVACPVGAIRFKGVKYWIDPEKCIDCGSCVEVCHNCVITGGEPEAAPAPHDTIRRDCDLVVVGAGGAGLIAAVRTAVKTQKKVIILEKSKRAGGNTWYASGFRTYHSKLLAEAGEKDKRDDVLREFMSGVLWQQDHQLVNNVLHAADNLMDWLIEDCGCDEDFVLGQTPWGGLGIEFTGKAVAHIPRPDCSIGPGGMGTLVVLKMLEQCEKLGIEILTEHTAEKLLTDSSGRVTGVLARDPGGVTEIRAAACVLATGCFSRNEELVKKANPCVFYEGEPIHYFSIPTCTGDGIRMAEEAGAEIDYETMRAVALGPAHHPFGFATVCICRQPEIVFFNLDGRRWANETNEMALRHLFHKQPGLINYAVADSNIAKVCAGHLIERKYNGEKGVAIFEKYLEELEEEAALDTPTKKADTLEELAEKMGVPADVFVAEVERYNELCRKGHDDDFFKAPEHLIPIEKPPFYAFFGKRFQENAMGGSKTDNETRVLDKNGKPILGLYAVGDNAKGILVKGDIGVDFVERLITALTWCVASGYMAGEAVSEFLAQ